MNGGVEHHARHGVPVGVMVPNPVPHDFNAA